MAKIKEISRRIKSVSSTKKITKAMEMVAAAKMRKAIEAVLRTRTYASLSWETILHLAALAAAREEELHPFLKPRPTVGKVALILITSNRGMCGGYNTAIITKAKESIEKHPVPTDLIVIGKRGAAAQFNGSTVAAEFEKSELLADAGEIAPIVKMALDGYRAGTYDKVLVAYTDFVNPAKQVPRVKQLLPVDISSADSNLGAVGTPAAPASAADKLAASEEEHLSAGGNRYEYLFEPSAAVVLKKMVPRLIEAQLYQAFLESNASEHSARMTAMHQATEAATEMVEELTLFYNKARQAGITAEIAEISAGANALAE